MSRPVSLRALVRLGAASLATLALAVPVAAVALPSSPAVAAPLASATPAQRSIAEAADAALAALWARSLSSLDASRWAAFAGSDVELTAVADQWTVARSDLAHLVAEQAGVSADELDAVWQTSTDQRLVATLTALSQVGVPYRRNSIREDEGLDCSGLVAVAWRAAGVQLPHQSGSQINLSALHPLAEGQPGDIAWFPGHVMLYLGVGGAIVHAPHSGARVEVRSVSNIRRLGSPIG